MWEEKLCDQCGEKPAQYSSGGVELCEECADGVGWLEALEDW